jgi:hypothetical protein
MFAENGTLREDGVMIHDVYLMRAKAPAASRGNTTCSGSSDG